MDGVERLGCADRPRPRRARRSPHCAERTHGRGDGWLPGTRTVSLPDATRFSIIPFSDLKGLDLENVRWPLIARNVPLGSTLTLSNIALGPVTVGLKSGYGLAVAYPMGLGP